MKQAFQPGFYDAGSGEVEVRAGVIRPDNHPDVLHLPTIFRTVDIEEPAPPPAKTPRRAQAQG